MIVRFDMSRGKQYVDKGILEKIVRQVKEPLERFSMFLLLLVMRQYSIERYIAPFLHS